MREPLARGRAVETRGAARFCRDFLFYFNAPGCYTSGRHPSGRFPAPTDATRPQTRNCMSWCAGAELVRAKHILILQFNISDQSRPRALTCCVHHPKCASRTTKPTRCFIILYMRSALRKCTRGSVVSFSTFQIRINAALLILTLDFFDLILLVLFVCLRPSSPAASDAFVNHVRARRTQSARSPNPLLARDRFSYTSGMPNLCSF